MQVTHIQTDHSLMAVELRSTAEFPIRFYLDIMDEFEQACIQWHWHPELEFNVITRGTIEYYVENEHYTLTAGQGILKNANVLHMAEPAKNTPDAEMFSIIMDPEFIAPARSVIYQKYIAPHMGVQGLRCLPLLHTIPWQRQILDDLRKAYALSLTKTGFYELHIHILMCRVWQAIAEHAEELPRHDLTAAERTNQIRIKQMIAFIQEHFRDKLTLDQIAGAASISRNTCLNCFRTVLGLSPIEFLSNQRIEHALHLLLSTDLTVVEVAEACGFGDASYFGKAFRKKTGLSPTQYRDRRHQRSD